MIFFFLRIFKCSLRQFNATLPPPIPIFSLNEQFESMRSSCTEENITTTKTSKCSSYEHFEQMNLDSRPSEQKYEYYDNQPDFFYNEVNEKRNKKGKIASFMSSVSSKGKNLYSDVCSAVSAGTSYIKPMFSNALKKQQQLPSVEEEGEQRKTSLEDISEGEEHSSDGNSTVQSFYSCDSEEEKYKVEIEDLPDDVSDEPVFKGELPDFNSLNNQTTIITDDTHDCLFTDREHVVETVNMTCDGPTPKGDRILTEAEKNQSEYNFCDDIEGKTYALSIATTNLATNQEHLNLTANILLLDDDLQLLYQQNAVSEMGNTESLTNPNEQASLTNPNEQASLTNPNEQVSLTYRDEQASLTNPNEQASLTNPNEQASLTNPNEQASLTNPNEQASLTNPDEQASLTNPNEQVSLTNPNEQVSLTNPDEQVNERENDGLYIYTPPLQQPNTLEYALAQQQAAYTTQTKTENAPLTSTLNDLTEQKNSVKNKTHTVDELQPKKACIEIDEEFKKEVDEFLKTLEQYKAKQSKADGKYDFKEEGHCRTVKQPDGSEIIKCDMIPKGVGMTFLSKIINLMTQTLSGIFNYLDNIILLRWIANLFSYETDDDSDSLNDFIPSESMPSVDGHSDQKKKDKKKDKKDKKKDKKKDTQPPLPLKDVEEKNPRYEGKYFDEKNPHLSIVMTNPGDNKRNKIFFVFTTNIFERNKVKTTENQICEDDMLEFFNIVANAAFVEKGTAMKKSRKKKVKKKKVDTGKSKKERTDRKDHLDLNSNRFYSLLNRRDDKHHVMGEETVTVHFYITDNGDVVYYDGREEREHLVCEHKFTVTTAAHIPWVADPKDEKKALPPRDFSLLDEKRSPEPYHFKWKPELENMTIKQKALVEQIIKNPRKIIDLIRIHESVFQFTWWDILQYCNNNSSIFSTICNNIKTGWDLLSNYKFGEAVDRFFKFIYEKLCMAFNYFFVEITKRDNDILETIESLIYVFHYHIECTTTYSVNKLSYLANRMHLIFSAVIENYNYFHFLCFHFQNNNLTQIYHLFMNQVVDFKDADKPIWKTMGHQIDVPVEHFQKPDKRTPVKKFKTSRRRRREFNYGRKIGESTLKKIAEKKYERPVRQMVEEREGRLSFNFAPSAIRHFSNKKGIRGLWLASLSVVL